MLAGGLPRATHAQGAWPPIDGTLTVVNDGPGDQVDPHVSGELVSYTASIPHSAEMRYHNLRTGVDASIPTNGGLDFLSDISGSTTRHCSITIGGLHSNRQTTSMYRHSYSR
jgi:hypothetical protein